MGIDLMAFPASLFLVTPLVLVILIDRRVRSFQVEAFGHLRKAARNLRIMAWVIFLYYLGVLLGSLLIGDLPAMFTYPLAAEGVQIYVRVGAAIAAYVFAYFVAQELHEVVRVPNEDRPPAAENV